MAMGDLVAEVRALLRVDRGDEAEKLVTEARNVNPLRISTILGLAMVRLRQRRFSEAALLFGAAIFTKPELGDAYAGRAIAYLAMRQRVDAELDAGCVLALDSSGAVALRQTARLLMAWGQTSNAVAAARRAEALEPNTPEGAAILAEALSQAGMREDALLTLNKALGHHHGDCMLWTILGTLLITHGGFKRGVDALGRARALDPSNKITAQNLARSLVSYANTLRFDGRLDAAIAALHQAVAIDGHGATARSLLMFCLLSRATTSSDELHASARASGAAHEAGIAPMAQTALPIGRPTRIGFLAPKLVQSSVKYFLRPVFDHHDSASAHLYLYDEGGDAEEHARLVRGLAAWRDIKGLDNTVVARRVRADGIDVLVDLAGHGWYGRRLGVFAHRPAPVQATCIGYPGTLGMTSIGHRLTDRHLHPPGCGERFNETLAFLPHAFCYAAPDDAPAVAPLPALAAGRITFASFNQIAKIDDVTLRLWGAVLAAVPTARLLIKRANLSDQGVIDGLQARMTARGIAADRVAFAGPRDSHAGHLATYGEVDIALDTFPYNGTTTTCEALWMGVPVVTRIGDREVSRTGLSLLAAAGLERWAADDEAAYVRIAAGLATDISVLARLRSELRGRLTRSALCDGPAYARHFLGALLSVRVDTPNVIC